MKKHLLVLLVAALPFAIKAQSLSPQTIASSGGFSTNANGSLSYTVGEMTMVQTFSNGGNILTQGFQQPDEKITSLLNITQDDYGSFVMYPNPAIDNYWFGFQMPEAGKVEVSLTDELGQKVADVYSSNYDSGKSIEQSSVANLAAGMYFLTMNFTSSKDGQIHQTTKKLQVVR